MKNRRIRHLLVLAVMLLSLGPLQALALEPGEPAPDFALKDPKGQDLRLSDFRGKPVLLKLSTTWCPTCRELTKEISKIRTFLEGREIPVIEVFVQDSESMVEKHVAAYEHPTTYRVALDDGQAYRAYNVYLIPRLILIDAEQVVRYDAGGRNVTGDEIVRLIEGLPKPIRGETTAPATQ